MDKTKIFSTVYYKKYVCLLYLVPYIHWYLFLKFYAILYDIPLYIILSVSYDFTEQKKEIYLISHVGLSN